MRYPQSADLGDAPTLPSSRAERPLSPDFDRAACRFFREHNGHPPIVSLNDFLARFERAVVMEALTEMNGCQRRAAALLKVKNTTLNHKIRAQHIRFVKTPY